MLVDALDSMPERQPEPKGPPWPRPDHPCAGFYRPPRPARIGDRLTGIPEVSSGSGYAI